MRTRQVLRTEELGVSGQTYRDSLTLRVLAEALQDRDLPAAIDLVGRAEVLLAALPDPVDGATGSRIPSRLFRTREWADLLAFKLGLSVGEPDFAAIARELETIAAPRSANRFNFGAERYERLLPLYRWLDARVRGQAAELPKVSSLQRGPAGFDPVMIVRQLSGVSSDRYQGSPIRFWAGVKAYVDGDRHLAATELNGWLAGRSPGPPAGFEMGAAARLLATQRANVAGPR